MFDGTSANKVLGRRKKEPIRNKIWEIQTLIFSGNVKKCGLTLSDVWSNRQGGKTPDWLRDMTSNAS